MFSDTKKFNTPLLNSINLKQVTLDSGRHYETELKEKFYSVTTFLSKTSDKTALNEWKKRVGKAEADRISKQASSFGTKLHSVVEKLLLNEYHLDLFENNLEFEMRFKPVKKFLEKEVHTLYGSEIMMCSPSMKLAGCCDLIYQNENQEIILGDFKTSKKPKKIEWLESYFLQLTAYSIMVNECFNIVIDKAVIIFSYEDGSFNTVYFQPINYFGTLRTRLKQFYEILRLEKANLENQLF